MKRIHQVALGAVAAVLFLFSLSAFTVNQSNSALVLRLGELQLNHQTGKADVYGPGLHFRMPFVTQVRDFDMRLHPLDVESSQIMTAEQKYLLVDYYAKWRISDLALYYKRTGGMALQADQLLKQSLNSALRAAFGKRTIKEVVAGQRLDIMNRLQEVANKSAAGLGIEVVDVRIRRIDLPPAVTGSVYQRMASQREQFATTYRSQGEAQAEALRASADADVTVRLAQAKAKAAEIRAEGTHEAGMMYAKTYGRDPQFYALYRSLKSYQDTLGADTTLVLGSKSAYLHYLNQPAHPASVKRGA